MKKSEFLEELRSKLGGLPKKDLESRISFYDEMISDRMDEGKSEEEAVSEIGSVDEVVDQIAGETSLVSLVKEKTKPKRSLKGFEIVLLVLGFPLWFPLLLVTFILTVVGYFLIWILVIVTYVVEAALLVGSFGSLVVFIGSMVGGNPNLIALGSFFIGLGGACLFIFLCIGATKVTIKLSKAISKSIKSAFIRKGN